MSIYATDMALTAAGIRTNKDLLESGRVGVSYGSSFGNVEPVINFAKLLTDGTGNGLTATSYIRMMSHTAPVNIGLFFGLTGRLLPTSTACTSGSMGIGLAFEAIRAGQQEIMVAGGAEELNIGMSAVFDTLFATSSLNDAPKTTPRPYDTSRDGLVVGEGAATLILEEYEHAKARGAEIFCEIVGFGTNTDGNHATRPHSKTMQVALELALNDSGLSADAIDFVSGHGTATSVGDVAETEATRSVFERPVPIHSLKGHFGHTLGACGAIEAWLAVEMMRDQWFAPTANLKNVDPLCAGLDFIQHEPRSMEANTVMSNNFAFGGINTSLIFKLPT